MIDQLVLFGASGDLAGRFLLPALAALRAAGRLPEGFTVLGTATSHWDDAAFRRHVAAQLDEYAGDVPTDARAAIVDGLRYRPVDVTDRDSVAQLLAATAQRPVVAYLALPPGLFPVTVRTLGAVGLPPGSRIALEKPFGDDLASARELNALLDRVTGGAGESAVFRVDHVLGMATVHNLVTMRMANPPLEAVWNSRYVQQVDILWEETLALEGRAGYYDTAGALKDVVQNHMLQILSLVAMELPSQLNARDLRDAMVTALRSVLPLTRDDVATRTRRARYTAGRLAGTGGADGGEVPDYADEEGVDPSRGTETYAEVLLEVDNPRWAGTRFRLRAGKALAARRKGVRLRFKPGRHPAVENAEEAGHIWIGVDGPNDVRLELVGFAAGGPGEQREPVMLTGRPPASALSPYGRVLLEVLSGDSTLSVRGDEAEEAWRVLTSIPRTWALGEPPLLEYPAGSSGPPSLDVSNASGAG